MTFIVGIRCMDGIVVAADSLESDSITNRYRTKLESIVVGDEWGVCWGGSGSAFTVDKFSDKFRGGLGNSSYNRSAIENHAEACLQLIRESYSSNDGIAVVLGLFGKPLVRPEKGTPFLGLPEFYIYRGTSEAACLSPEKEYCFAGMDVTLASYIFENIYLRRVKVSEANAMAVFATSMMKKYATGVGGDISVNFYLNGSTCWSALTPDEVFASESMFSVESADQMMSRFWACNPDRRYFVK